MRVIVKVLLGILLLTVVEVEAQPDTLWTRTYECGPGRDELYRAIRTSDGGYLLGGKDADYENPTSDYLIIKTDSNGEVEWSRSYDWDDHDQLYSVAQAPNGEYIMVGSSDGDPWCVKVDTTGELIWAHTYGMLSIRFDDVAISADGQIVAAGATQNGYVVKIDTDGDLLWEEEYGGNGFDSFARIRLTHDGGFILAGCTASFGHSRQGYAVKIDSSGREEWSQSYGGERWDYFSSVIELEDGCFILGGGYEVAGDQRYLHYVVKTDPEGEEIWSNTYGLEEDNFLKDIIAVPGGGLVLAGHDTDEQNDHEYAVYRLDGSGEVIWELDIGAVDDAAFTSVLLNDDGGYLIAGHQEPDEMGGAGVEFWTVRTAPDPASTPILLNPASPSRFTLDPPFPNPFNSAATIGYQVPVAGMVFVGVYDLQGRQVAKLADGKMQAGSHRVTWVADNHVSGIYLCRMEAVGFNQTVKLLLTR